MNSLLNYSKKRFLSVSVKITVKAPRKLMGSGFAILEKILSISKD
jgi:hypothetical protein